MQEHRRQRRQRKGSKNVNLKNRWRDSRGKKSAKQDLEKDNDEDLQYARARAAHAPDPIRGPSTYDIFTPRQEVETTAPVTRGRSEVVTPRFMAEASRSRDGAASSKSRASSVYSNLKKGEA